MLTLVWILLALILILFLLFAVLGLMVILSFMWEKLPQFVYNMDGPYVGFCAICDYNKSKKICLKTNEKIMVQQTLVFVTSGVQSPYASGEVDLKNMLPSTDRRYFGWLKLQIDLFVPHASTVLPISQQLKFFTGSEDPKEFEKRKIAENLKADPRMRFAKWMGPRREWLYVELRERFYVALIGLFIIIMGTLLALVLTLKFLDSTIHLPTSPSHEQPTVLQVRA